MYSFYVTLRFGALLIHKVPWTGTKLRERNNHHNADWGLLRGAPSFLDEEAKKEWRHIVAALADLDVLKPTDSSVRASYCMGTAAGKRRS